MSRNKWYVIRNKDDFKKCKLEYLSWLRFVGYLDVGEALPTPSGVCEPVEL